MAVLSKVVKASGAARWYEKRFLLQSYYQEEDRDQRRSIFKGSYTNLIVCRLIARTPNICEAHNRTVWRFWVGGIIYRWCNCFSFFSYGVFGASCCSLQPYFTGGSEIKSNEVWFLKKDGLIFGVCGWRRWGANCGSQGVRNFEIPETNKLERNEQVLRNVWVLS